MTEYQSEIKKIPYSSIDIFKVLSDLNNLELVKDKLPEDKIDEIKFDKDSCTLTVPPIGEVTFEVVERKEPSLVKLQGKNLPIDVKLWIQIVEVNTTDSRLKLTAKADLNFFMKPMVDKPLKEGIAKLSEVIATLPYGEILEDKQ